MVNVQCSWRVINCFDTHWKYCLVRFAKKRSLSLVRHFYCDNFVSTQLSGNIDSHNDQLSSANSARLRSMLPSYRNQPIDLELN